MGRMYACNRSEIQAAIAVGAEHLSFPALECPHEAVILQATVDLMYDHALGGALVCLADTGALKSVFAVDLDGNGPALRSCDDGYMTRRLRGIRVSDPCFAGAFEDFPRHSAT